MAATARKTLSELERFEAAAHTFKLKYNYLPGDIPNASQFGLTAPAGIGGSANGNGLIESYASYSYQAGEVILFWRHLQQAGLIATSIDVTAPMPNTCVPNGGTVSEYWPLAAAGGNSNWFAFPGYSESTNGAVWGRAPSHGGSLSGKNYMLLAVPYTAINCILGINSAWTSAYKPQIAAYIDNKRDDGLPESGKVMIVANTGGFGYIYGLPNYHGSTACLTSTTQYNLTNYVPASPGGSAPNWDKGGCTLRIQMSY